MGYQNGEYYIAVNDGWMAWAVKDFGVSDFQYRSRCLAGVEPEWRCRHIVQRH